MNFRYTPKVPIGGKHLNAIEVKPFWVMDKAPHRPRVMCMKLPVVCLSPGSGSSWWPDQSRVASLLTAGRVWGRTVPFAAWPPGQRAEGQRHNISARRKGEGTQRCRA